MSEPEDAQELEQLHRILEEAGPQGTHIDTIFDSLKIDVQDLKAVTHTMDRLAALEREGLAHSEILQRRDGRGIETEIRWYSGKRPKGRKRPPLDPGFLFSFLLS